MKAVFKYTNSFVLQYVVIQVNPEQQILWGGTDEPCGFASLKSIGQLGVQENKKHAATISEHLDKNLGIPGDRYVRQTCTD